MPYRDSKLTFLLKDALGGRARCTLLACVSPAVGQLEETLSTLKFAQRAKLVKVRPAGSYHATRVVHHMVYQCSPRHPTRGQPSRIDVDDVL